MTVEQARAQLKQAEEEFAKQQRAADEQKLKDFTAKGREAKQVFDQLEKEFNDAERRVTAAEIENTKCEGWLAGHIKPNILDFPTDQEMREWEVEHNRLLALRESARTACRDALQSREQLRLELLKAHSALSDCRGAVQQLTAKLA
jgi:hypothetical protein